MPYANVSEVPDYVPKKKRKQWMEIWNKVYKEKIDAGESKEAAEKSAYAQATGVVNKESKGAVMDREIRFVVAELRATGGDKTPTGPAPLALEGYAATFNSVSHDLNGFKERIMPGAFSRTLKENADVRALKNHDPNFVLGRTKAGTLKLEQDSKGLRFRVDLPDTQYARDLHTSISRGDMDQCSFAFKAVGQKWSEEQDGNGDWYAMRELHDVDLFDISAVTYPAYEDTSVSARGDIVPAEIRSSIAAKKAGTVAPPEKRDDDSYEEMLCDVRDALAAKFPSVYSDGRPTEYNNGRYYICETYSDYVIAVECSTGDYFKISYTEDEASETYSFGTPQPVEKQWVPAERYAARVTELRKSYMDMLADKHMASALETYAAAAKMKSQADDEAKAAAKIQAMADAARLADLASDPEDGDSENEGPWQNRIVDEQDVWDETQQDDTDGANDGDNGDEAGRTAKRAERRAAARKAAGVEVRADGKVRTKRVGGKNLTKDKFAYVGDPERTETWKLPIHDAAHARNALARFNQTQGIPSGKRAGVYRKIVAAAKKFGITVSDEENSRALATCDMDETEKLLMRAELQRSSW